MCKKGSFLIRTSFGLFLKSMVAFFVMWMAFVVISQIIDVHPAYTLGVEYIIGVVVGNIVCCHRQVESKEGI